MAVLFLILTIGVGLDLSQQSHNLTVERYQCLVLVLDGCLVAVDLLQLFEVELLIC